MDGKQIGVLIALIFLIPTLIALLVWSQKISKNPTDSDNIKEGVNIVADAAIPWWLGTLKWLAGLPGIIGAVLVIGFVLFLKWIGEFKR